MGKIGNDCGRMSAIARICDVKLAAALGGVLILAGCAGQAGDSPDVAPVARAPDAIALFAASATPGSEGQVTIPETGQRVSVRLIRAYAAASGRECREVAVGGARTRLICRIDGGWIEARPLVAAQSGRP